MFDVNFYTVSKNTNSTAQPTGQGTVYSCILKKPSSIIDPVLQLQLAAAAVPSWNYCYISAFSRYYFINNWTALSGGIWEAALAVDVLATYKTTIGDTTFLIERASAASDGTLTDSAYPTTQNKSLSVITKDPTSSTAADTAWGFAFPDSLSSGRYILSVINGSTGSNTFYALTYSEFNSFKAALFDSISWYDGGSVADGLKKSIANPFQYVNSCFWFPVTPLDPALSVNIKFGFWDSGVSAKPLADKAYAEFSKTINNSDLPKHPQAATRGSFLNCSPYTRLHVYMNPWGSFEIDPSFIALGLNLRLSCRVDFVSAVGTLKLEAVDSSNNPKMLLHTANELFGVQIPITQRSVDLSGAAGVMGGAVTAAINPIAGVTQMLGGAIQTAVNTFNPSLSSKGARGSLSALTAPYRFYFEHFPLTAEDNARQGRPLMQNYKPSALNGYMRVVDPDMVGDLGTLGERQQVLSYLSGGFYYE